MNAFFKSDFRTAQARRQAIIEADTYDELAELFKSVDLRSRSRFDELLKICDGCGTDGRCPACGCLYKPKLISTHFICGMGKFSDG